MGDSPLGNRPRFLTDVEIPCPIPRGPGEGESKAHTHTCRNTYVHTQPAGSHMGAGCTPLSHRHLTFSASLSSFRKEFYFCSARQLSYETQRAPSRAGQVARSTSSGFGPWKAAPSVPSSVWASRRAVYSGSRASRGGGGARGLEDGFSTMKRSGRASFKMQLPSAGTSRACMCAG